jgi:hypothetical protein
LVYCISLFVCVWGDSGMVHKLVSFDDRNVHACQGSADVSEGKRNAESLFLGFLCNKSYEHSSRARQSRS